jgi:Na+-translocating ferredoxin:NAD+ oxidoreductase RNF subunit RnfB
MSLLITDECIGHFDSAQCVAICPVDCIILDPDWIERQDSLHNGYLKLTAEQV